MPTDNIRRTCSVKGCHKQFTRPQGSNRLKCFDCSPERRKSADSKIINGNFGRNQDQQGENSDEEGPLTRLSREHLDSVGVLDTWQAEAVLTLARQIDAGKGGGSAGVAGAIRAHRDAMAVAEGISTVGNADVIDMIFSESS